MQNLELALTPKRLKLTEEEKKKREEEQRHQLPWYYRQGKKAPDFYDDKKIEVEKVEDNKSKEDKELIDPFLFVRRAIGAKARVGKNLKQRIKENNQRMLHKEAKAPPVVQQQHDFYLAQMLHGDFFKERDVDLHHHDQSWQPSAEEVREYAGYLGVKLPAEEALLDIVSKGLKDDLPNGWILCKNKNPDMDKGHETDVYYFNSLTGVSTWEHPNDALTRNRLDAARAAKLAADEEAREEAVRLRREKALELEVKQMWKDNQGFKNPRTFATWEIISVHPGYTQVSFLVENANIMKDNFTVFLYTKSESGQVEQIPKPKSVKVTPGVAEFGYILREEEEVQSSTINPPVLLFFQHSRASFFAPLHSLFPSDFSCFCLTQTTHVFILSRLTCRDLPRPSARPSRNQSSGAPPPAAW